MALTEHELLHLNAIIDEAEETKNLLGDKKNKLMKSKNIEEGKEEQYLDKIIKDSEKIKKDNVFPDLESPSDIHDYIEKYTKEEFKNG